MTGQHGADVHTLILLHLIFLGESVEENANLVIRLLIRRPECLGPALQGEGEGLLTSIISGNLMSEQIQAQIETGQIGELGYTHPVPQGNLKKLLA